MGSDRSYQGRQRDIPRVSGLSIPVPGGLPGGISPVDWTGSFGVSPSSPGVQIQWQWGAAVCSKFTTNYNALGIKAGHQTACGPSDGDHAGTPEGAMCPGRTTLLVVRGAAAARTGRVRGAARIRSNLVVHHNCFECFFRMLCDDDFLIYCAVSIRAGSLFRKRKAALRVVDLVVCPMLYASVSVSATQLSS